MKAYQRFSQPTWGITLEKRHNLYHQHLLPIITYACAGWFLTDPLNTNCHEKLCYSISKSAITILESLQTEILLFLSKAWKRTPKELIENEMHVKPIVLKLHEVAMNHRCRKLDSKEYEFMQKMRSVNGVERRDYPHTQMGLLSRDYVRQIWEYKSPYYDEAQCKQRWANSTVRRLWVKDFIELKLFAEAKERFNFWLRLQAPEPSRNRKFAQPAYQTNYGDHTMQLYFGLDTAQQTMLLGMRTGNIGVKANPVFRKGIKTEDMSCPKCGGMPHTVKHLLCECPKLSRARTYLTGAAGHNDFDLFMNHDTELAASWAIVYFGLSQFDSVKDKKKYQFSRQPRIIREES